MKPSAKFNPFQPAILLTILYILLVSFVSSYHEVWRDEMHSLSIVRASSSFLDLLQQIKNEGMGILWYALLYFASKMTASSVILKIVTVATAAVAIYIVLQKAPFSWWQRVLIIFGVFPFYEYAAINRPYTLAMLLVFAACAAWPKRHQTILPLAVILSLLANISIHSIIISVSMLAALILEEILYKKVVPKEKKKYWMGLGMIAIAIMAGLIQIRPDSTSIVKIFAFSWGHVFNSIPVALFWPAKTFVFAMGTEHLILLNGILWIFYLTAFRKPAVGLFLYLSFSLTAAFSLLVYPGMMRHQGFFCLILIAALWLEKSEDAPAEDLKDWKGKAFRVLRISRDALFVAFLGMQVWMGIQAAIRESKEDFSPSKRVSDLIKSRPELQDAIILSEPDFLAEALPYYLPNRIYDPREHKFGTWVHYTTANDEELSLKELLATAKKLKGDFKEPVVIMMGHTFPPQKTMFYFSYNKIFRYTESDLKELHQLKLLGAFRKAISDEWYDVYELP